MSVINQVLLDLERRRASAAERSMLPSHVRALPGGGPSLRGRWILAGSVAGAAALAGGWIWLAGTEASRTDPPAARSGTEAVIEKVVTASAGVSTALRPGERGDLPSLELQAFRLSAELANPPAEPVPGADAGASLSSSRLISRMNAESAAGAETPAVAAKPARNAAPKPAAGPAAKPAAGAPGKPAITKEMRQPAPRESAENEYRKAAVLLHQGKLAEAEEGFDAALRLYPEHNNARQGLVGLLLQGGKLDDAEHALLEGIRLSPSQTGFNMTLARLQVNRGAGALAITTLQKGLEHAQGNPEYAALLAALLQRQGRHEEAVAHFQAALRARPDAGVWWLGLGISLQAVNRTADAQEAYRRARASNNLHPELAAYADQRLKQLQ